MWRTDGERYDRRTFERELQEVCRDLTYISETDAPVEPFFGPRVDEMSDVAFRSALQLNDDNVHILKADRADFFRRLTARRNWHDERQRIAAEKFERLKKLLESNLEDVQVFKVGRIRIEIYIVGIESDGTMAGVKTKAVET